MGRFINLQKILEGRGRSVSAECRRVLFKQGDLSSSFFYIQQGQVELQFDGNSRRILGSGDFFGEIRTLGDLPRTATATCLTSCRLIELDSDEFNLMLLEFPQMKEVVFAKYGERLFHARTRSHPQMFQLSDDAYENILKYFELVLLPESEFLFSKGDQSTDLYMILRGDLLILNDDQVVARRQAGEFVGEIAGLLEQPRIATAYAYKPIEVLRCSQHHLKRIFKTYPAFKAYLRGLSEKRLKQSRLHFEG